MEASVGLSETIKGFVVASRDTIGQAPQAIVAESTNGGRLEETSNASNAQCDLASKPNVRQKEQTQVRLSVAILQYKSVFLNLSQENSCNGFLMQTDSWYSNYSQDRNRFQTSPAARRRFAVVQRRIAR